MRTFLAVTSIVIVFCTNLLVASDSMTSKLAVEPSSVLVSNVKWEQLNPARGDQSPKAGTLWGDRTGPGPAGFLLKPADGFMSPPHIHNTAYRGVVIRGLIHNDDPNADAMYMPTGSFWTQPAGGVHITAAKGSNTLAYIEVEDAFGVLPANEAFPSEEKPINVDESNLIWLDASNLVWIAQPGMSASAKRPEVAFLWGNPQDDQLSGALVKLPAGFAGMVGSPGSTFRAVVIQGQPQYQVPGETSAKTLAPGSYFSSKGASVLQLSSESREYCVIYVRMKGKFDIRPTRP